MISACITSLNEEKMIGECIKALRNHVDEIIICDAGSTMTLFRYPELLELKYMLRIVMPLKEEIVELGGVKVNTFFLWIVTV